MAEGFEWDPIKRGLNLGRHGIDFEDAVAVFEHEHLILRSDRNNEERWIALGRLADIVIIVAFAWRGGLRRLISARPANRHERQQYFSRFGTGPSEPKGP